jgi:GNAT acetyltransferase-like protein
VASTAGPRSAGCSTLTNSGQGYAIEAVHAVPHWAFVQLDLRRVVALVNARNDASLRLGAHVGMRREAHLVANEWFKGQWSLPDQIVRPTRSEGLQEAGTRGSLGEVRRGVRPGRGHPDGVAEEKSDMVHDAQGT